MKLPANIDYYHSLETLPYLLGDLHGHIQKEIGAVPSYFVDQRRGRAYLRNGKPECFTIPLWILSKSREYQIWYVAHEVAHILEFIRDKRCTGHSVRFHQLLKEICPQASQHYEWEYMKRSKARGLGQDDEIDNLEDLI
jgi:hypothetical protein